MHRRNFPRGDIVRYNANSHCNAHSNRRSLAPTMWEAKISKCGKHRRRESRQPDRTLRTPFLQFYKTKFSCVKRERFTRMRCNLRCDIIEMRVFRVGPKCIVRCTCQSFVNLTPVRVIVHVSAVPRDDDVSDAGNRR